MLSRELPGTACFAPRVCAALPQVEVVIFASLSRRAWRADDPHVSGQQRSESGEEAADRRDPRALDVISRSVLLRNWRRDD